MTKLRNKQQQLMEKILALLLLVFAIGLLVGEGLRDYLYGETIQERERIPKKERIPGAPYRKKGKKWKRYSGLFILLKQKWSVPDPDWRNMVGLVDKALYPLVTGRTAALHLRRKIGHAHRLRIQDRLPDFSGSFGGRRLVKQTLHKRVKLDTLGHRSLLPISGSRKPSLLGLEAPLVRLSQLMSVLQPEVLQMQAKNVKITCYSFDGQMQCLPLSQWEDRSMPGSRKTGSDKQMKFIRLGRHSPDIPTTDGKPVYLLAGLGNPGREYRNTRHNVGFMVIDRLSTLTGISLTRIQSRAMTGLGMDGENKIILAKPVTYMNLSGQAIAALMRFYKIPPERLLVIHDDIDLPLGTLRLRPSGSSAGQKGLASTIERLGTEDIARLRVGVGRPPGQKMAADYVLQPFARDEQETLTFVLDRAAEAALTFVRTGLEMAMNRYNGVLPKD
ncbi:MAG TPA: aminoacyl-tRNA hydrolase [Anaerolineales bacterium]